MKNIIHKLSRNFLNVSYYKNKHIPVGTNLAIDIQRLTGKKDNLKIFDVGANVGQSTLYFKSFFPKSTYHIFEPVQSTFELLQKNVKSDEKTFLNNVAMGDREEVRRISLQEESVINSLLNNPEEGKSEEIKVITIDDYIDKKSIGEINLLKIDVEGYEEKVIKGAEKSFKKRVIELVLLESNFQSYKKGLNQSDFKDNMELMHDLGFNLCGIYDQTIRMNNNNPYLRFANTLFIVSK